MDPLRLEVAPCAKGYSAASHAPAVTALGHSAEEAAENGRLAAIVLYAKGARPEMLIVCSTEPGHSTIVMQPIDKPVSLAGVRDHMPWRYMASIISPGVKPAE